MVKEAVDETGSTDLDDLSTHLVEHGFEGAKADYAFDEDSHNGISQDQLIFVVASTSRDGTSELAPGYDG